MSTPSCSTAQVQSSCSSFCNESSWSVSLAVSDTGRSSLAVLQLQKGEGIFTLFHSPPSAEESRVDGQQQAQRNKTTSGGHRQHPAHHYLARLEPGDPPLNVSTLALGSSQPLWGRYTSNCCSAQAELLVWNTAGNMKRCRLMSGQQRQQRDKNADTSGAEQTELKSGIFLWMVYCGHIFFRSIWFC